MTVRRIFLTGVVVFAPVVLAGQGKGLDSAQILKPLADVWPTYSGDYSGRRFSTLAAVNRLTVTHLTLAWAGTLHPGAGDVPIVGGEGPGDPSGASGSGIKGTPLMVDGTLYVTTPDNVWAMDARDGHELWHYYWKTRGGTHIANRGAGMWNDYLYVETPDN